MNQNVIIVGLLAVVGLLAFNAATSDCYQASKLGQLMGKLNASN